MVATLELLEVRVSGGGWFEVLFRRSEEGPAAALLVEPGQPWSGLLGAERSGRPRDARHPLRDLGPNPRDGYAAAPTAPSGFAGLANAGSETDWRFEDHTGSASDWWQTAGRAGGNIGAVERESP